MLGIHKSYFVNTIIKFTLLYLALQFLLTVIVVPKSLNSARTFIKSSDINILSSLVRERKFIDSVQAQVVLRSGDFSIRINKKIY